MELSFAKPNLFSKSLIYGCALFGINCAPDNLIHQRRLLRWVHHREVRYGDLAVFDVALRCALCVLPRVQDSGPEQLPSGSHASHCADQTEPKMNLLRL